MKFLLCVLLSSCAIQAMDAEMDAEADSSETNFEFNLDFERDFDDWQQRIQENPPSDNEEAAESGDEKKRRPLKLLLYALRAMPPMDEEADFSEEAVTESSDEKAPKKRIKRTRPTQQNFSREALIEIVRQNLYRLGGIAQPAAPAVAYSFLKPHYANGTYHITCPVCCYKLAAKEMGKSQCSRIKKQLKNHLKKSKQHPFDGASHYTEEWLRGRVIPLYEIMVAGRNFKDLCTQGHDALLEDKDLPAENPYTLKKIKYDNKG